MIYIDPPYNTGNDFVYDDDFTEPLQEYLRRTGQIDGEGRPMTTNKKTDGRFHSKWLSMMYPRLRLARELLRHSLEICRSRGIESMEITINSSPNSVQVYERLGFRPTAPEQEFNGIRFTAMSLEVSRLRDEEGSAEG